MKISKFPNDRSYWVSQMTRIADPVLKNLANDTLKQNMPYDFILDPKEKRRKFSYLEAIGRVICGIAPWFELESDNTDEGKLRSKYLKLAVKGLSNLVNPQAMDYVDFGNGQQSLVDAAYLSQGLLRAPKQLWGQLDKLTQQRIIYELKKTRVIKPNDNNWLLFASMIEAALYRFTEQCNKKRLLYGVKKFIKKFYKGDGIYGDGNILNVDYYNSFVIHPMLTDILMVMKRYNLSGSKYLNIQLARHIRFAEIQERLISPEGTYPIIGRTITCRFGVFHALSQVALMGSLPNSISPEQVRSGLTAIIKRQLKNPLNFDQNNWLEIGLTSIQHSLAEEYVNRGSSYHCLTIFLPLGLPKEDVFWSQPYKEWTNLQLWNGKDVKGDYALIEINKISFKNLLLKNSLVRRIILLKNKFHI
ncbi:DUF2264 domain-containing protein [Polaribacter sp. Q13]|uniref:DUF2264 domain-containing protein n=1 Tax=Polaribacter sp. Q13 TaxID=2806551 RepID=UPI00193C5CE0|nr:DUF2264 domain-containing protein [Polaribacter sp. Q13]QVY66628.1 DUF2264 domain-containing protein [Polaribacter sp. Q13]